MLYISVIQSILPTFFKQYLSFVICYHHHHHHHRWSSSPFVRDSVFFLLFVFLPDHIIIIERKVCLYSYILLAYYLLCVLTYHSSIFFFSFLSTCLGNCIRYNIQYTVCSYFSLLFMNPIEFDRFPIFEKFFNGHGGDTTIRGGHDNLLVGCIPNITNGKDSFFGNTFHIIIDHDTTSVIEGNAGTFRQKIGNGFRTTARTINERTLRGNNDILFFFVTLMTNPNTGDTTHIPLDFTKTCLIVMFDITE
mmetsp:Transcript_46957/g.50696  ORF Transcript_46957/g.50696 Transcript_46957/m.50696 type:complete len:249 (-) Transcript_46957:484-1230(-)